MHKKRREKNHHTGKGEDYRVGSAVSQWGVPYFFFRELTTLLCGRQGRRGNHSRFLFWSVVWWCLMKALIQQFFFSGLYPTLWIFHETLTLKQTSAGACVITCGQPLIMRELLNSSSANCSTKQTRGWMFYQTSTLLCPWAFSSHETPRLSEWFYLCDPL